MFVKVMTSLLPDRCPEEIGIRHVLNWKRTTRTRRTKTIAEAEVIAAISIELNWPCFSTGFIAGARAFGRGTPGCPGCCTDKNVEWQCSKGFPVKLSQVIEFPSCGIGPDKLLNDTLKTVRALKFAKPSGICPESLFLSRRRFLSCLRFARPSGILPVRPFDESFNTTIEDN
eukprot:Gb_12753 [translate_table: standard]